jgi:hypothetical protein
MHPSVKRKLQLYYQEPSYRLYSLLGRDFHWTDPEAAAHGAVEAAAVAAEASSSSSVGHEGGSSSRGADGSSGSSSSGTEKAERVKGAVVDLFEATGVAAGSKVRGRVSSEGSLDGGIKAVPAAMAAV